MIPTIAVFWTILLRASSNSTAAFCAPIPARSPNTARKKAQELAVEAEHNRLFDKFHAQEEAWIRKGIEARRTRNEGRVRRLEELRRQRAERRNVQGQVNFKLDSGEKKRQNHRRIGTCFVCLWRQSHHGQILRHFAARRQNRLNRSQTVSVKPPFLKLILGELQRPTAESASAVSRKLPILTSSAAR